MSAMLTTEHLQEIGLLPGGPGSSPEPSSSRAMVAPVGKGKVPAPAIAGSDATASSNAASFVLLPEKTPEELAKMSKDERREYHMARRAAQQQQPIGAGADSDKLSKAQRRAIQEAQRKAKEDKKETPGEFEELLKDLKMQGLTEEQAKEVIIEMRKAKVEGDAEGDDDEDDVPEDYFTCVRMWMKEQETIGKDTLSDFNMKVRFQGHTDTTPPDHLAAVLSIICEQACADIDLSVSKLQPTNVAKKAEPLMIRWASLLEAFYGKIDDPLAAADAVVGAVQRGVAAKGDVPEAGQACGVVGCLMGIREIDMIEDEDLLTGCKRSEPRSRVMDKFVEFLEDEVEGDEESDDD